MVFIERLERNDKKRTKTKIWTLLNEFTHDMCKMSDMQIPIFEWKLLNFA